MHHVSSVFARAYFAQVGRAKPATLKTSQLSTRVVRLYSASLFFQTVKSWPLGQYAVRVFGPSNVRQHSRDVKQYLAWDCKDSRLFEHSPLFCMDREELSAKSGQHAVA